MKKYDGFHNKLIIHPNFYKVISDLNKRNVIMPYQPLDDSYDFNQNVFPPNGKLSSTLKSIKKYKLNMHNGEKFDDEELAILAYDESVMKYLALEGTAYFVSHSLVLLRNEYIPINYITFSFYTKSSEIASKSEVIKNTKNIEIENKKDYIQDRINFLLEHTPKNSILFIDGPLIGGDYYTYMIQSIKKFLEKNIITIFFVKNSSSNLVTDNIEELKNKYNSDLHWSHSFLKNGEYTNFFKYHDLVNPKNAKMFCYLKAGEFSPLRVEVNLETYSKYKKLIFKILDFIYYMILVQGDKKNPQMRLIAIAEKYAREFIKMIPLEKILNSSLINPTMNQARF